MISDKPADRGRLSRGFLPADSLIVGSPACRISAAGASWEEEALEFA
jgi:hypothetical protein